MFRTGLSPAAAVRGCLSPCRCSERGLLRVEHAEQAIAGMMRVLRPSGRLVIGEIGYWSLWAAWRHFALARHPIWREARFRTARELRALTQAAGLNQDAPRNLLSSIRRGAAASMDALSPFNKTGVCRSVKLNRLVSQSIIGHLGYGHHHVEFHS